MAKHCVYYTRHYAAAKSLQSCPTLCDPIDGSPPGSPVPGILQARTLGWVAISFSNALKWKVKVKSFSRVGLLATPWTAAYQAPPSMGFSRQEYQSGVPLPSPAKDCMHRQIQFLKENLVTRGNSCIKMQIPDPQSLMPWHPIVFLPQLNCKYKPYLSSE